MLRNIAKLTARLPQTKTSQRSASQLNSHLGELQEQIKQAGSTPNPLPVLKQLRTSKLYDEVWEMLSKTNPQILTQSDAHLNPELRTMAQAYTICYALDGVTTIMGMHFDLKPSARSNDREADRQDASKANDRAFLAQIKPEFENTLKSDFRTSWNEFRKAGSGKILTADEKKYEILTRMAAVSSVVAPDALSDFKLSVPPEAKKLSSQWGDIEPEMQLNKSELLALIDYVNSVTGTFNASNYVALANEYYGDKVLTNLTQVYSEALNSAVKKLCAHPYFGLANIQAYKGVLMENGAGFFRLSMLESAVGTGKLIAFPPVISATTDPLESYAAKKYGAGYHHECAFTLKNACSVDIFHDKKTKGEMEVIAPAGQKFIVTEKRTTETFDGEIGRCDITQFVLVPAEKPIL